jgi:hypothetical protein
MSSLLDLPNEIILCILEYLPVHTSIHALYSSCKHFSWLKSYRFGLLWKIHYGQPSGIIYTTIDINGVKEGPKYIFNRRDLSLSGFIFYKAGNAVGESCYVNVSAFNTVEYAINGDGYHSDGIIHGIYENGLKTIHEKLQQIDGKTFGYICRNYKKRVSVVSYMQMQ